MQYRLTKVISATVQGVDAFTVEVEVDATGAGGNKPKKIGRPTDDSALTSIRHCRIVEK